MRKCRTCPFNGGQCVVIWITLTPGESATVDGHNDVLTSMMASLTN